MKKKLQDMECEHNFNPVTRMCTKCTQHIYDGLEEKEFKKNEGANILIRR